MVPDVVLDTCAEAESVIAQLGYLKPANARPYDYACEPPNGVPWHNYETDSRAVRITDARGLAARPSIEEGGFALWQAPSGVRDFYDEDAVTRVYYGEAAEIARAATGAKRAYVFDHLVRKREAGPAAMSFGRRVSAGRPSANGRVHNDYTEASGPKRRALVLAEESGDRDEDKHKHKDEAASGGVRRYAIVNIWRPIAGPVLDAPLALCDARSVAVGDLVTSDVHYATRTGEIYLVQHSPRHRWFYYPGMDRHEALVFKQYDSQSSGVPRFVPHAAFEHPHTPSNAPLRESIEVRCLVVYE